MNADFAMIMREAENGNPFAMYELAHLYDLGVLSDPSETKFIYWFKKFWETREVQAALYNYDCEEGYDDSIDIPTEMMLRDYIIEAGLALGLYYMNSTNIDEACFAFECLSAAWTSSRFAYIAPDELDGKTDIAGLLRKQSEWLEELGVDLNARYDS